MSTFHLGSYVDPIKDIHFWHDNLDSFEHLRDTATTTEYLARCPAHHDEHPSLVVIHEPSNQEHPVRCHCRAQHAGCTFANIVHLLKERATLRAERDAEDPEMTPPFASEYTTDSSGTSWFDATQSSPLWHLAGYCGVSYGWLRDDQELSLGENVPESLVYYAFEGVPGQKPGPVVRARTMPPSPGAEKNKETFWKNNRKPVPPLWPVPPQKLPEEIAICEGETDCIIARYWGFKAFALTQGGGVDLDQSVLEELKGRGAQRLLIFYDLDETGARCRTSLVHLCQETGLEPVPVDLRLLSDPLIGGHKDLRDYRHMFASPDAAHRAIRDVIARSAAQVDTAIPCFEDAYAARTHEDDWLVEDVLAPGCISLMCAKPGVGKSTIIMALAKEARAGGHLLDWPVRAHRLLLCTEEGTRSLWKKRAVFGPMPHVRLHSVDFEGMDEAWPEQVRIMADVARRHQCATIIVDTLFSFAEPEDEDKSAKVRPVFRQLRALTRQGFAVLITVHGRKGGGAGGDQIAGSIVIPGEVDIALEIAPADDGEQAHRKVSWIKNRLNPDAVGQPARTITVEGDHLVLLDDGTGLPERERKLLEFLDDHGWHGAEEIANFLACTQDQLRRPLENVCRRNNVLKERCDGRTGKKNTYRYRLPQPIDLSGVKGREQSRP